MLCSQLGVHIRHKEELMGLFSIVCHRLAESDLHDSTKPPQLYFASPHRIISKMFVFLIEQ